MTSLTDGQKHEVSKIVRSWIAVVFLLLGVAGYFALDNMAARKADEVATKTAREVAGNVSVDEAVKQLLANDDFINKVASNTVTVPSGVVLPFDDPDGCPPGWTEFREASGRFILGQGQGDGLTRRAFGDQGGQESIRLDVNQMPAHLHKYVTGDEEIREPEPDLGALRSYSSGNRIDLDTTSQGAGQPFTIMPPYIALRFCIRVADGNPVP